MRIEEIEDEHSIRVDFYVHRAIVKSGYILKSLNSTPGAVLSMKRHILKEAARCPYLAGKEKEILKEWSKIEPAFRYDYEMLYPRGGSRKNSGRPSGVRTKRTERINQTLTPDEKAFLLDALEKYRRKNNV